MLDETLSAENEFLKKYWNKQSHVTVELHHSKRRGDICVGLDMVHSTIW
jgi:hypothetical protein